MNFQSFSNFKRISLPCVYPLPCGTGGKHTAKTAFVVCLCFFSFFSFSLSFLLIVCRVFRLYTRYSVSREFIQSAGNWPPPGGQKNCISLPCAFICLCRVLFLAVCFPYSLPCSAKLDARQMPTSRQRQILPCFKTLPCSFYSFARQSLNFAVFRKSGHTAKRQPHGKEIFSRSEELYQVTRDSCREQF